jgi:hypothetical protein
MQICTTKGVFPCEDGAAAVRAAVLKAVPELQDMEARRRLAEAYGELPILQVAAKIFGVEVEAAAVTTRLLDARRCQGSYRW